MAVLEGVVQFHPLTNIRPAGSGVTNILEMRLEHHHTTRA